LARSLMHLATAEGELGNFAAAGAALDEADTIFAKLGSATWPALVSLRRGRLNLRLREPALALAAARTAGAYFEEHGHKANKTAADLLMGEAALAAGDLPLATAMGLRALHASQRYSVPALRYSSHLLLGQAAEAIPARQRAKRHYRAAAATVERVQRGLTITLRPGFLEDKSEALRRLMALCLQENQPRQALEVLEQAKSQLHLGYLNNRENLRWDKADSRSRNLIVELAACRREKTDWAGMGHRYRFQAFI